VSGRLLSRVSFVVVFWGVGAEKGKLMTGSCLLEKQVSTVSKSSYLLCHSQSKGYFKMKTNQAQHITSVNPSYSKGDQENCGWRPDRAKSS
jgi:hypothetical protein